MWLSVGAMWFVVGAEGAIGARGAMWLSLGAGTAARWRAVDRAFTTGDCERRGSGRRKNAAPASQRSPSSIESCMFAHEAVIDEPTPAFFHGVELWSRE
jgi:hypothetical protein